jgi:hypothetical protein
MEVFRSPAGDTYADTHRLGRGDRVAPLSFPDTLIEVDAIFA